MDNKQAKVIFGTRTKIILEIEKGGKVNFGTRTKITLEIEKGEKMGKKEKSEFWMCPKNHSKVLKLCVSP